jgi:hypothetical protein
MIQDSLKENSVSGISTISDNEKSIAKSEVGEATV